MKNPGVLLISYIASLFLLLVAAFIFEDKLEGWTTVTATVESVEMDGTTVLVTTTDKTYAIQANNIVVRSVSNGKEELVYERGRSKERNFKLTIKQDKLKGFSEQYAKETHKTLSVETE